MRIEVRLADEGGSVPGRVKDRRDVRPVVRRRDAIRDDSMRERMLPGEHRRTARHADDVLHVRTLVEEARTRERIDHRRAGRRVAGHSE